MKKNHNNKFKTPEGYFESFNERLMAKMSKEEGIIPKSDGFQVPEHYFEELPKTLSHKIKPKVVFLYPLKKYYWAAASIAALLLLALVINSNRFKNNTIEFEDLASTEIDSYLDDNQMDLTVYDLAQVVNLDNLTVDDITETTEILEGQVILDYLDDNVDEFEDLNLDYDEME
ncbi:Hypothetical protein I595_78 [Croceitalea dokdonensis DOKDO 023]|uniref:Uncharacterized protein n=1 Tax=Croceitalea dokdonensis DOKDO 023 TaxID=1300341 RepID=A0A0P7AMP1_9FLAO|nr:hypothetical protein [Croceitalea dokdonensis]KPM33176.1 Hypothetical protein I595_78 [Croceitalea dokdonensis DOKDO 023]